MKNNYKIQYLSSFNKKLSDIIHYITYKLKNRKSPEKLADKVKRAIYLRSASPEIYEVYKSKTNKKYI